MNDCYFAIRAALSVMRSVDYLRTESDNGLAALAELEREAIAAAPQFEAPEVTDEVADRVHRNYFLAPGVTSGAELGHQMISAVRSELGPTLGLVEIREPTPEECKRISMAYYDDETLVDRDHYYLGKDMFASVRAVMWPKSEGS